MFKLSVVIPTHNRFPILKRCLQALENQEFPKHDYEVIVVDDGSTDGTRDQGKQLVTSCRFKGQYFRQEAEGPGRARNRGIQEARGDVVLLIGDDIFAAPNFLIQHWSAHKLSPAQNHVVIGKVEWDPNLNITPFMSYLENGIQFSFHKLNNENVDYRHCYTANVSVKSRLLKEGQIFFSKELPFAAYEDIEWGYRLMKAGALFRYVPEALGFHHHPVTMEAYKKRMVLAGRAYSQLRRLHPDLAQALSCKPKNGVGFFKHAVKGKTREFILNRPTLHATLKKVGIGKSEEKWVRSVLGYYQEVGFREEEKIQAVKKTSG